MTTDERSEYLCFYANEFLLTWKAWQAMKTEDMLTRAFEDRVQVMIDTFATGDIPAKCRRLMGAVADVGVEWRKYLENIHSDEPMPGSSFWAAVERLDLTLTRVDEPEFKPLESVRSLLIDQKVSPRQIATRIYGYCVGDDRFEGPFMKNNVVQIHLIEKEAATPGSVIPEGWVHPEQEKASKEAAEKARMRLEVSAKPPTVADKGVETIEELVMQGVSTRQIGLIKSMTESAVIAYCNANGVRLPKEPPAPTPPKWDTLSPDAIASAEPSYHIDETTGQLVPDEPVGLTAEEVAEQMIRDGQDNAAVKEMTNLDGRSVAAIRRRIERGVTAEDMQGAAT